MININDPKLRLLLLVVVTLAVIYWAFHPNLKEIVCGKEGFASQRDTEKIFDPRTGQLVDPPLNDPLVGNFNQLQADNLLDDGANGLMGVQNNLCSRSCCGVQFPPPFNMKEDPFIAANRDKFAPSNYFCNNVYQDAGCLCVTKDQDSFFDMRGGNGGSCNK